LQPGLVYLLGQPVLELGLGYMQAIAQYISYKILFISDLYLPHGTTADQSEEIACLLQHITNCRPTCMLLD
jgi:hypothetical protein